MKAPLVVILGPTASGKSSLAIRLARSFCGEIVNCDSVQVYRQLDIGSSKPTPQERGEIPHHLMDIVNPDEHFTAGEYLRRGREVLAEVRERRHLPIVVGGTGLYLRALLMGLFTGPRRSEELRDRMNQLAERKGTQHLHRILLRVDPVSATKISAQDKSKVIRALEVFFLTSKPISWHFGAGREPLRGFSLLKIGLNPPREMLYSAIDRRVEQMFAAGLVGEVRSILQQGYQAQLKALQSLGYSQVIRHLRGELSLDEALDLTQRETRRYAKRQLTWFRKEPDVLWLNGFGGEPSVQSAALARTRAFIESFRYLIQIPFIRQNAGSSV